MSSTPYAEHIGAANPADVLRASLDGYTRQIARLTPARWNDPYAPGKWTVREVMLHVAQWEMIFGVRLRCGVSFPTFTIQPLHQDPFMAMEAPVVDGPTAFAAFDGMRRMNIAFASALTPAQLAIAVTHPERGRIDVKDLLVTLAGHSVHHLKQLESIA